MSGNDAIAATLRDSLGLNIASIEKTVGGDINDAYRAVTGDGEAIFVKSSPTAQAGMFTDEAAGLEWLSEPANGLNTPAVVGVVDGAAEATKLLALRWIDEGRLTSQGAEELGRGLAAIHAAGAPAFGATPILNEGGYTSNPKRLNELSLPNERCDTWAEFYADRRIRPLTELTRDQGRLNADDAALMERLCARLPQLAGPEEVPARIHGDLWTGNVMADRDGSPVLIDPVAYGGHRELDLANLQVFGSPGQRCFDAYAEVAPLAEGHAERVHLWQLEMILIHVYLFGGSYVEQARSIAYRYA